MTELADVAVIGAGVVGLGVARALARAGREVVVLDSERSIGFHTSSRNSEVIHSGIYYPPGALMAALRSDAEAAGAQIALATPVLSGRVCPEGVELVAGPGEPFVVRFRLVVNCAGPWAQEVARRIEGVPPASVPPQHFAKGHYFVMPGHAPFRHLVYPVPVPGGLGTHLTLDLAGQVRFGPDVQWTDRVEYSFDESRAASFYQAIRRYYPGLPDGALAPGFTGVRAKIAPVGAAAPDFEIQGPAEHGVPGLVNLYGIESPGLTSVLALSDYVRRVAGC